MLAPQGLDGAHPRTGEPMQIKESTSQVKAGKGLKDLVKI